LSDLGDIRPNDPNKIYLLLEAWLRTWEDLLKKPGDILLERSFLNIIPSTLVEIRRSFLNNKKIERSAKGWGRVLLGLLEEEFDHADHEIHFVQSEYSTEMASLKQSLKQGTFDTGQIYTIIEILEKGPATGTIFDSLKQELMRGVDADFDLFIIGSKLILRNALATYSVSSLKEKLHISLARHGTYLGTGNLLTRIKQDSALTAQITTSWNLFIRESASDDPSLPIANADGEFCRIFDRYSWERKARDILSKTAELIAERVKGRALKQTNKEAPKFTPEDEDIIGMFLIQEYSAAYLRQLFELPIDGTAHKQDENLKSIGHSLGDVLLSNGFEDRRFGSDHRPNPVDSCCTEAFVRLIKDIAARKFATIVQDNTLYPNAIEIGRTLLTRLQSYEVFKELKWESTSDKEIETVCRYFMADLTVQNELTKLLAVLNPSLEIRFKELLKDSTFISFCDWLAEPNFWQRWHGNFLFMPSWEKGIFYYVPWEMFQQSELDQILRDVSSDFETANDNFLVVFILKNLHPPKVPRTIASVTFYDPYRWNFGEQFWREEEDKGKHTSALIKVEASTFLEAKRKGMSHLMELLNCMALSLSVNRMRGGFKPIVDSEIFAKRVVTSDWSSDRPLVRTDRPIAQSFENFEKFGPMFDFIIQASRSANATMIQTKLLKALHWYSRAKWEPDPAQSFLFYWIGLEHLFEEEKGDLLLDLIAKLHVNWRDVLQHGWYFLTRHEEEVLKQLGAEDDVVRILNGHTSLSNWQRDLRVLLNHGNARAVLDLIPVEQVTLKDYVHGYAEYLENFSKDVPAIIGAMHSLRDNLQFRLLALKHLRNDIVHQALSDKTNVGLYTDELEEIFEESIVKLTNEAIRQIPECSSIKDLISKYEEMWIS
jgi:hypothetical protein